MLYYTDGPIDKTTCVGNTLSTFNQNFSALDNGLYELSSYSVNSINYLSSTMVSVSSDLQTDINYLSSTMVSVSGSIMTEVQSTSSFLFSNINTLSSTIQAVSANVVSDYTRQGILTPSAGTVNWNVITQGHNAKLVISSGVTISNPVGLSAGDSGNLLVQLTVSSASITGFGSQWMFAGTYSSVTPVISSKNLISYYYDGEQLLSNMLNF